MMKEILTIAFCSMLAFSPPAGGNSTQPVNDRMSTGSRTEIVNPFAEYETLEAAAKAAGFGMTAPDEFEDYTERTIRVMQNQMIEIIYLGTKNGIGEGGQIIIRKAAGTGDISGDYNSYTAVREVDTDGISITMKGDGENVKSAIWTVDGYAFSVSDSIGMSSSEMQELIRRVK